MKRKIKGGLTSVSLGVFIADTSSTTGGGLSGVTNSSSGLVLEYRRAGQSTWTSVTPVSKTLGTYTSGGIVADGSLAGAYEVDFPDAAFASGARFVLCRIRGVTNMLPVLIEVELDAVDYQDSTRFGLGAIPNVVQGNSGALPTGDASGRVTVISNQDKTGYSLTQSFPSNFSLLSIDGTGRVTVGSNADKTGYSLTQSFPSNFASMAIDGSGRVTVGSNADKTGYALTQAFPANFSALSIDPSGQINSVGVVDELGPSALDANGLVSDIAIETWSQLTTYAWPNDSLGKHILISNDNNRSVKVVGAGAGHVAADVHAIQSGVIISTSFGATALTAIADGVLGRATSTSTYDAGDVGYVLRQIYSMIVADGADWQYTANALELAPAGGGGGGGTDWTSSERTAIRSILGFNSSGVVSIPTDGVLDAIKDKTDLITSGSVQTSLPVTASGQITGPLYIGDDYLNANGRAFAWTVALPTGYVLGTSTCRLGMEYMDESGSYSFVVTGTVIDAGGGNVTLRFDVPRATTETLAPGWYRWSVEHRDAAGVEITRVASGIKKEVEWREKQT